MMTGRRGLKAYDDESEVACEVSVPSNRVWAAVRVGGLSQLELNAPRPRNLAENSGRAT